MEKMEKFGKVFEMMKNCCPEEGEMADCCSMMKKMMQCGEKQGNLKEKKEENGEKE
jgi:hypothetical protein